MMIFFWIFKLSDIDQGIQNTLYKKTGVFSVFEEKNLREKKKQPILSYPGLHYAHKKLNFACKKNVSENVCLRTKLDLRLKKNKKKVWSKISKLLGNFFVSQ